MNTGARALAILSRRSVLNEISIASDLLNYRQHHFIQRLYRISYPILRRESFSLIKNELNLAGMCQVIRES
jgi:hypothetical protein